METEKAIEDIKRICEYLIESDYMSIDKSTKISLETMLREFKKQEKMIELMLEEMTDCEFEMKCGNCNCECERDYDQLYACNKQYFENKANEEAE